MMSSQHPSYLGRLSRMGKGADEGGTTAEPEAEAAYLPLPRYSQRACCCPGQPTVVAVIPPANGRHAPTELLLCGHHYRQSRTALAAVGATLLDVKGHPLTAAIWPGPSDRAT